MVSASSPRSLPLNQKIDFGGGSMDKARSTFPTFPQNSVHSSNHTQNLKNPQTGSTETSLFPDTDSPMPALPDSSSVSPLPVTVAGYGTTPSGKPRLFVCSVCTRAFARQEHLKRHERSHTREKPFDCGICSRKFSRRDLLLRHAQKLHAGCSDTAIRRLRRRRGSAKSIGTPTTAASTPHAELSASESTTNIHALGLESEEGPSRIVTPMLDHNGSAVLQSQPSTPSETLMGGYFNRNQAPHGSGDLLEAPHPRKHPLSSSVRRRASFSASSGSNYAIPQSDSNNNYPEHVEFSTPQMMAVDEFMPNGQATGEGWLGNLGDIPELDFLAEMETPQTKTTTAKTGFLNEMNDTSAAKMEFLHRNANPSLDFQIGLDKPDPNFMRPPPSLHSVTNIASHLQPTDLSDHSVVPSGEHTPRATTYSFYDQPEAPNANLYSSDVPKPFPAYRILSPMVQDNSPTQTPNPDLVDPLDINEILNDLNDAKNYYSTGYSFYNMDSAQTLSSNSTNATISPRQLESQSQSQPQPGSSGSFLLNHGLNPNYAYSKTRLFTYNLRTIVYKSLAKYPFVGYPTPHIPSNEKLEQYLAQFIARFLNHYPILHPSMLNEYEMMQFSQPGNHNEGSEAAFICLPLLIASIGAITDNQKVDGANLYEASRRCIHVFLESRKDTKSQSGNGGAPNGFGETGQNSRFSHGQQSSKDKNPLWLVQALTLSVIHSLFADCDVNLPAVLRQVNALGGLLNSSPQTIEEYPPALESDSEAPEDDVRSLFTAHTRTKHSVVEENFLMAIKRQLKCRTVLVIYNCIMSLAELYNVPPRLTAHDLRVIELPSIDDETVWNFNSFASYEQNYIKKGPADGTNPEFGNALRNDGTKLRINFMDTLYLLINNDTNRYAFEQLSNFAIICLIHGIYDQFALISTSNNDTFEESIQNLVKLTKNTGYMTRILPGGRATNVKGPSSFSSHQDIFSTLAGNFDMAKPYPVEYLPESEDTVNSMNLDARSLLNYLQIKSIFNLNAIKEKVFFNDFEGICDMLTNMQHLSEADYLKVICSCNEILKFAFFSVTDDGEVRGARNGDADDWEINESELGSKISLNYQILFDVFLISAKFVMYMNDKSANGYLDPHASGRSNSQVETNVSADLFGVKKESGGFLDFRHTPQTTFYSGQSSMSLLNRGLADQMIILKKIFHKFERLMMIFYKMSDFDAEIDTGSQGGSSINLMAMESGLGGSVHRKNSHKTALRMLKIGAYMFKYMYDFKVKVIIFQKLADALLSIRSALE